MKKSYNNLHTLVMYYIRSFIYNKYWTISCGTMHTVCPLMSSQFLVTLLYVCTFGLWSILDFLAVSLDYPKPKLELWDKCGIFI